MRYVEHVKALWQARLAALDLTAREEVALESQSAWYVAHPGEHQQTRAQLHNCWALWPDEARALEAKLAAAGFWLDWRFGDEPEAQG